MLQSGGLLLPYLQDQQTKKWATDVALLHLPISSRGVFCAVQHGDGVAVLLPFLGVSSLNFGPLARAAFFLARAAGASAAQAWLRCADWAGRDHLYRRGVRRSKPVPWEPVAAQDEHLPCEPCPALLEPC